MSYLNALRLHFAGRFQASVSTVNNDPVHYDNSKFQPSYQQLQSSTDLNGWWNPEGAASWRLIGCNVTAAFTSDGSPASQSDTILSCIVADSDRRTSAKMADLDGQQQMVSEIWGLEMRICDSSGNMLLRGQFTPIGFMDIWPCCPSAGGSRGLSAMYQSVLTQLEWGDVAGSPFLTELQHSSPETLSIKFNVDGYNTGYGTPGFTYGRIAGTIGPSMDDEPQHFVTGRQLLVSPQSPTPLNFCVAVVDEQRQKILVDLGNALPTVASGGLRASVGDLAFGYTRADPGAGRNFNLITELKEAVYTAPDWYETTAGIVELPADRPLTNSELTAIQSAPLAVLSFGTSYALQEDPAGLHVRADQFVYRLNPDEQKQVKLYATTFGKPYSGARIISILDSGQLQQTEPTPLDAQYPPPAVAVPTSAIDFPARVVTDQDGMALLLLQSHDPGNPRGYLDGQVYGIRPILEEHLAVGSGYVFNPVALISVLVWDDFKPSEPISWWGTSDKDSLQYIFQQYANLYPVMLNFLDLGSYESVCEHRELLLLAFGLDVHDPNYMPAVRDLSATKRDAILKWLADETPVLGTRRQATPAQPQAPKAAAPSVAPPPDNFDGSKATALQNRLINRRK
ncbi:MAG TPA: hypothetical protein VGD58_06265 [Herpetosiphonaceae bacterium]